MSEPHATRGYSRHDICWTCWRNRNGEHREPYRVVDAALEVCCFCGELTKAGICVRDEPQPFCPLSDGDMDQAS